MGEYFKPGQRVEAFGLSSEAGQKLNGRRGTVFRHHKATDRVEVHFDNEKDARSLQSERLRPVDSEDGPKKSVGTSSANTTTIDIEDDDPETPASKTAAAKDDVVEIVSPSLGGKAAPAAAAKTRTLDDLEIEDNVEVFGLTGFQAQYNGTSGVIMQIGAKGLDKRGVYMVKFSELIIDSNGELAEKGQVLNLVRANCRVPGSGPPGEKHERPPGAEKAEPAKPPQGFSKAKKSRSRSRSRRKKSRSKSRRRRSSSRKRRRR